MAVRDAIPFYFTYGEAPRPVDLRFAHVEATSERQHEHHGRVAAHRHMDLHQLTFWVQGGGTYFIDDQILSFEAPMLALAPGGAAHGFEVRRGSDGLVVSVSDDLWREAAGGDDDLASLMDEPRMLTPTAGDPAAQGLRAALEGLRDEHRTARQGRSAAIAAHLKLALVNAARLVERHDQPPVVHDGERDLTRMFRAVLEKRYAEDWGVGDYARALNAAPAALNAACRTTLGRSVLAAVHARRLAEAKRLLVHTTDSVAEIGYRTGFLDPAYFSRFFKRHTGLSPQSWRADHPSLFLDRGPV